MRAAGLEWRDYDGFMQKFVKRIGDERLSKVPGDLDTKPYRDEHDDDLLRRMLACVNKGQVPQGFRWQQLKDAASTIRRYLRRHGPGSTGAARRGDFTNSCERLLALRGSLDPSLARNATGDVIAIRYAADTIVGFQHEHEAKAFLTTCRKECARSNWRCTRRRPG